MFHAEGNHYDPLIDGPERAALTFVRQNTTRAPGGRALYTRRQLRGLVAGEVTIEADQSPRLRRIWPDEPNVGLAEEEMALKIDGALRIGGPTLKTYTLNNDLEQSRIREARVVMTDTYRKLQASEDQLALADMLNAVGAWKSELSATVGNLLSFETEVKTDSRTYLWGGGTTVQILRRGSYLVSYRMRCTPNLGSLTVTLTVGSQTFAWSGTGLSTILTIVDSIPVEKTDDVAESVTITNTLGTSIGSTGASATFLQIVKLR